MRSETMNTVAFYSSFVVFLLHSVGYLAPGWFVQKYVIPTNTTYITVGGQRLTFPSHFDSTFDATIWSPSNTNNPDEGPDVTEKPKTMPPFKTPFPPKMTTTITRHSNPTKPSSIASTSYPDDVKKATRVDSKHTVTKAPVFNMGKINLYDDRRKRSAALPVPISNHDPESNKNGPLRQNDKDALSTKNGPKTYEYDYVITSHDRDVTPSLNNDQGTNTEDSPDKSTSGSDVIPPSYFDEIDDEEIKLPDNPKWCTNMTLVECLQKGNSGKGTGTIIDMGDNDIDEQSGAMHKNQDIDRALYLTCGLWYSRACVSSGQSESKMKPQTEWCTLFIRNDTAMTDGTLFEMRVEATVAAGLSFLSLFISSTGCCCRRHYGRRAAASLLMMFVSGVLMAIPVGHVIRIHVRHSDVITRERNWMQLHLHTHEFHDVFDHYAAIISAVGSILAVVTSVIVAIVRWRHPSTLRTRYRFDRKSSKLQEVEAGNKNLELPVCWVTNQKITLPPESVTKTDGDVKTGSMDGCDGESGFCDVKDDVMMSVYDDMTPDNLDTDDEIKDAIETENAV